MTPLGHAGYSLLLGTTLLHISPNSDPSQLLSTIVAGGGTPDLDLFYSMYKKGSKVLDKNAGEHRFYFTHTPFFLLGISLIFCLVNLTAGIYFAIGAMIHLLLDTLFFPEGINFAFPFDEKRIRFFTINLGQNFWAKKPIAQVPNWKINYLRAPLFWIFEVIPTLLALALVIPIVYKS